MMQMRRDIGGTEQFKKDLANIEEIGKERDRYLQHSVFLESLLAAVLLQPDMPFSEMPQDVKERIRSKAEPVINACETTSGVFRLVQITYGGK